MQKIQHIIWIIQENRSFDNYFGTYPGANGFARIGFTSTHESGGDEKPDISHVHEDAIALLASSSYDPSGTYITPEAFRQHYNFADYNNHCFKYHNGGPTDLFNYWAMADTFVLQDFMFESCKSYSLPSHLYLVSGWSANCNNSPCKTELEPVGAPPLVDDQYKWTSIASLLNINDWKYYKGLYYNTNCTSCNTSCFNGTDGNIVSLPHSFLFFS